MKCEANIHKKARRISRGFLYIAYEPYRPNPFCSNALTVSAKPKSERTDSTFVNLLEGDEEAVGVDRLVRVKVKF